MGLDQRGRPGRAELRDEVRSWADEMPALSPTALKAIKQSLNGDTAEHFAAVGQMAYTQLKMFTETDEAKEGIKAFNEKARPTLALRGA